MLNHSLVRCDAPVEFLPRHFAREQLSTDGPHGLLDPPDGGLAELQLPRRDHKTDEFDAADRPDGGLVIQIQVQDVQQKRRDGLQVCLGGLL